MSEAQGGVSRVEGRHYEISGSSAPETAPAVLSSTPSLARASHAAPRQITSSELLGRDRELLIVHQGRQYHLRVTQNGKLILTA
jgi:hemin uptake protein HemP